ncbi:uncharacterized protein LOC135479797 [Liolophura sinensis]|uniref:uncharacterized protein LOC135479797 n=1 Tax=Liolophura sinensis TaxID=3198878 RepID=UPI003157F295
MRRLSAFLAVATLTGQLWNSYGNTPKSSYACEREGAKLTCDVGERIAIRGVEYNVRKQRVRPCSFQPGDCRFRVNSDVPPLSAKCAGVQTCLISETHLNPLASSPDCPGTSLYRTIHYDCIADKAIGRMCTDDQKVGSTLYLANEEYPHYIKGRNSGCSCSITSEHGSKVSVTVNELTLDLKQKTQTCRQSLNMSDSTTSTVFDCSSRLDYYGYRELFSGGPKIAVELKSDSDDGGRFLFQLTGDGELSLKCQQRGETPTAVHSQPEDSPASGEDDVEGDDEVLDVATIVGIAIAAAVMLIAVVVFGVCCCRKRRKKLERKSSERTMDIREGVVDPFIVTANSSPADDNRKGTGTFRPSAPPHELVYATPGYSAPWESYALPASPPSSSRPSSRPLSLGPLSPPPSDPPPPVPSENQKNDRPSHYTYITPDILDHVTPGEISASSDGRPTPAVRRNKESPNTNGSGLENGKKPDLGISRDTIPDKSMSNTETIFVDNSLYQSAGS